MNFQIDILDGNTRGTIQSLLPPSAKNLELLHGFTFSPPQSPGQTYRIQAGEHVTAAGDGKVTATKRRPNSFRHSVGLLDTDATWQVTIHHGFNVYTTVQGMATITVQVGTPVVAGQDIGTPLTDEIFFQILYRESPFDPASISRFFRAYDGGKVPDKVGYVRQGPDIIDREAEDVQSWSDGDIHYFVDKYCRRVPRLLNIDFAGTGAKFGFAAIGSYGTDVWNVYTHSALTTASGTGCVEVLQGEHTSSGSITFSVGTLVECLHAGTLSDFIAFYAGTLVECLHAGTLSDFIAFYAGTLVECLHTGTISNTVSFLSGGTELADPWLDGAEMGVSTSFGTISFLPP